MASIATTNSIPSVLFRRSARFSAKRDCKYHNQQQEQKRFKGSEVSVVKIKAQSKDDCDSKVIEQLDQPDGYLDIDVDELDLERTLLGGQSFRWTKNEAGGLQLFTGILHDYVFQLWRPGSDRIAFKILNKTSNNIKLTKSILEDYFQLRFHLKDLYRDWSERDSHLANCCNQYKGFRILRQDPVENVFSFICATNNNIKRISQMIEKLCRRYGDILENTNNDKSSIYDSFHAFPLVEQLAEDDVFDCLRYELGFGYRAKFINQTAKYLIEHSKANGYKSPRDYLLSLRQLPYRETCKELMKLPGIGRKVADCICLMSMDHLNSVPIDCHIYEIVCRHYLPNLRQERKTLTEGVHDTISKHFTDLHGPLAGWSTSVLFIAELRHLKQTSAPDNDVANRLGSKSKKTKVSRKESK